MHPAPTEHPDAVYRLDHIRSLFAEEPEHALTLVVGSIREVTGAVASATLARFEGLSLDGVPGIEPDGAGGFEIAAAGGDRFVLTRDRSERDMPKVTLGIRRPTQWNADNVDEVAMAILFERRGSFTARGQAPEFRIEHLFDFADAVRDLPGVADAPVTGSLSLVAEDVDAATESDGGLPGDACRALVAAHLGLVEELVLRSAAEGVVALASAQRAQGLEWGKALLAYDDTDKRTTSVSCGDGRAAILHEDIDLMADHNAFILAAEHSDGSPTAVAVWLVDRYKGSVPDAVEAFAAGEAAPEHVVTYRLDLASGQVDRPDGFDPYRMAATVDYGVRRATDVISKLVSGELELGGYNEVRTSFDCFDPADDEFDDEDDLAEEGDEAAAPGV